MEVITQIKLIPQEIFCVIGWKLQDLIAHKNTDYITQIDSPENLFLYK